MKEELGTSLTFIKFDLDNKHNVEKRCNVFMTPTVLAKHGIQIF